MIDQQRIIPEEEKKQKQSKCPSHIISTDKLDGQCDPYER